MNINDLEKIFEESDFGSIKSNIQKLKNEMKNIVEHKKVILIIDDWEW